MNTSLFISSGALQTYQQKLDTTSNNIANVNTTGYKRRDHSFSEILANQINNQTSPGNETGRLTPNGIRVSYGTRSGLTQIDMQQGQAMKTDQPFDLMIEGKGFFQVGVPSGAGADTVRYTRDGNFHLSPSPDNPGNYNLVHANGGYLLDQNGAPIELNDQYDVSFASDGQIQLKNKNGQGAAFMSAQQVGIVDITNPSILKNMGENQFAIDPSQLANGANIGDFVRAMLPGEAQVRSGFLEGSNVDLTKEMTDLMTTQRSFQMNSRAVSYADQMLGIANNILR